MRKREAALLPIAGRGEAADAATDPNMVTALARGLDVLRAFRRNDAQLGNLDLAQRTGLPKATVSRLTYTLSRLGYLVYLPEAGKYRLGAGVLGLGFSYLGATGIRDMARPLMQELADYAGVTVALGQRDGLSMVYVEVCRSSGVVHLTMDIGARIRIGTSAMGRAYIAALAPAERAPLLQDIAAREPQSWPSVELGINQARRDLADYGFTMSMGEWQPDVNAVGVPVDGGGGALSFALNCGGPAYLLPRKKLLEDIGPRLAAIGAKLRGMLGG